MAWWSGAYHPLVKAVAGFSVPLFLALNFPTVFLAIMAGPLFYAIALLWVVHAYGRQHRIVGRSERALQLAAKTLSRLKEDRNRTAAEGWERIQSRKSLQPEGKAALRRYEREHQRSKRNQTRQILAPTRRTASWVRSR